MAETNVTSDRINATPLTNIDETGDRFDATAATIDVTATTIDIMDTSSYARGKSPRESMDSGRIQFNLTFDTKKQGQRLSIST